MTPNPHSEWINDILFEKKTELDTIVWLGNDEWLIVDIENPTTCSLLTLRLASITPKGDDA